MDQFVISKEMAELIFWRAASDGNFEIVEYLLSKGVDVHICDDLALRMAVEYGHLRIVSFLLKNGASVNEISEELFDVALRNDFLDIAILLIQNGKCFLQYLPFDEYLPIVKFMAENRLLSAEDELFLLESAVREEQLLIENFLRKNR